MVDDNHFRGKKIETKKKKIRSNPSLYLACPHSVVFITYSWMCACVALFWLSKMATRTDIMIHHSWKKFRWNRSEEWLEVWWQWAGRKVDDENIGQFIRKTWNYVLWSCNFLSIFEVKLELQNAPDCTVLHLDFNIFQGGMPPNPPKIGLTFRFLDFHSIPPLKWEAPRWPCAVDRAIQLYRPSVHK